MGVGCSFFQRLYTEILHTHRLTDSRQMSQKLKLKLIVYLQYVYTPLLSRLTAQVGGAVRGGGLRDQPHPAGLLGGASGMRPAAGAPPLQLCGTLPQIQASLPLQGLPPWPGGAVQGLSIMAGTGKQVWSQSGGKRSRDRFMNS